MGNSSLRLVSGVSGAGGNMRGSRNFCQFYFVLSLFYSLQRGSNGFIAEKTILILYQGSRGGPLFSRGGGGGWHIFQGGGVQMLISLETHIRTFFSRGVGGVRTPYPAHGQCHHNGTIFITVPLLTIIVKHCFVRINDRWGFPNDALVLRTFDTFEKHSSWKWWFLQFSFFSPKYPLRQRSESNNIGDWLIQS